ncbi:MAG: PQQ-binding-like beta-propeller repeat protein [Acidobacteriaceae bacterium]
MRFLLQPVALCLAGAFIMSGVARAQGPPRGYWPIADQGAAHNNWQKAETEISTDTVSKDFKFLWKFKLGKESKSSSFSEPLLYPGLITGRGFKDLALLADASTLYAVDSELGELVWKKTFATPSTCGNIQVVTEPPQVIHFGAKPAAKPGAPAPPPRPTEVPLPRDQRRVGAAAGGGYFGLRGVYAVTSDGYIHEQIMATGLDYAPPVKFLGAQKGSSFALNMNDKVVYTATGQGCRNVPNAVWSIDLNTPDYPVNSYKTQKISLAGVSGPAIGRDGTVYVVTGSGPAVPPVYANSVVALTEKELKAKDWYTPPSGKQLSAGPVAFIYKEKELIAAPGANGGLVLLDTASLGGAGHHTPLAQTGKLSKGAKRGAWEGLATWQDKSGNYWVLASVDGPVEPGTKFANDNGPAPRGSIVASKVEEQDGHTTLTPVWISRDLIHPAPPVIANDVVFALEGGNPSGHATLYALDAATGKQLYTSGDAIQTYSHLSGMSVGDGHVFFTTHDNTLYSFGIPLEH